MSPAYAATLSDTMTDGGYYRVEVTSLDMATGTYHFAYSNPVFVKCPFDKDCDGYLDLIEKLLGSNPDDAASTPGAFSSRAPARTDWTTTGTP